jgi:hypothetical protein
MLELVTLKHVHVCLTSLVNAQSCVIYFVVTKRVRDFSVEHAIEKGSICPPEFICKCVW